MLIMGMAGGAAYASIPAFLKVRFNTNEILTSLMLVYVAQLFNDWLVRGIWRNPEGMSFPGTVRFHEYAILPQIWPEAGRAHWGFVFALIAAVVVWFMLSKTLKGFEVKVLGQSPRAGRFAGFSSQRMVFFVFLLSGALAGLAGISEVAGPIEHLNEKISIGYGFTAIIVAFLGRLNPLGIVAAGSDPGADLSRRRGGADLARRLRQDGARLPGHAAVLRARLRHADPLPHPLRRAPAGAGGRTPSRSGRPPSMFEQIIITIATAATPLLIAAIGELVVERSGVLNLGVEGMMVMGAVTGFAVAFTTGSPWLGLLAAIIVGALFSLLFGFLTLTLVTNQVATGLALTLLGLGLSGMIGESFVGLPGIKLPTLYIPVALPTCPLSAG